MKKLTSLSTADMLQEMSIAGNPEKVHAMFVKMLEAIRDRDDRNPAELLNIDFALRRLQAEIRMMLRRLEKRNNQKYL